MNTYQFQWRGLVTDLVIDVDAESKGAAVRKLQYLVEQWNDREDPSSMDVTDDGVYVRCWFNLTADDVTIDHIVDWWEKADA